MSCVAVVGAGFAGLTASAVLAARGHGVVVIEAGPDVGGKARAIHAAGARIDIGPTILLDDAPLRELCAALGITPDALAPIERLDPGFVVRFADGRTLAWAADPDALAADVRGLGADAGDDWRRFLDRGAQAERLTAWYLAHGDVAGAADLWRLVTGGGAGCGDVLPFVRHASLASMLEATVRTPALRALIGHFARFVGLDAAAAPAATLVIPYLLATRGVRYPRGGAAALAQALGALAAGHGALVVRDAAVDGLETSRDRVTAVTTPAVRWGVDACVAAVDVARVAAWLADDRLRRRLRRRTPAMTAAVAWWVLDGADGGPHHTFVFDGRGEPIYLARPTATDASLAPDGGAVLYALVHRPAGAPVSPALPRALAARLDAAGAWPGGRVRAEGFVPYGSSVYGYALRPGLTGAFHPSQRVPGVRNLALAGDSVFPGPGIANAIRSGLRAAALVDAA